MAENRIALVTGANKGIGLAISRKLAQAGVHVLIGSRDKARGDEAAAVLARGWADRKGGFAGPRQARDH